MGIYTAFLMNICLVFLRLGILAEHPKKDYESKPESALASKSLVD